MNTSLREVVFRANMELNDSGLVLYTFGNVSGADWDEGVIYIKPSGVDYADLSPEKMVPVEIESGKVLEEGLKPSSDTPTHLEIYRAFKCGGVVHTHSQYATALAQSSLPIRCMGTTHADYFYGDIPITRSMTVDEVKSAYEKETGTVIVEAFKDMDPKVVPGVLVANHGPFAWGDDPFKAVHNGVVLEYLAKMECASLSVRPDAPRPAPYLVDKHYFRKHGDGAYYGQG